MDTDTRISVIAGRPGAGKTRWAAREVVETLRDVNNVVIYIGFDREFERICRMVSDTYGSKPHGKLLFALQDGAGEAIGKAVDIANNGESRMYLGNEDDDEYQNNRPVPPRYLQRPPRPPESCCQGRGSCQCPLPDFQPN